MDSSFARLFVPQAVLDEWSVGEHILLDGEVLSLSPSGWRYRLRPAIHVQKCVSGQDHRGVVGKVWLEEKLREGGAELYQGSIIWGDDAYEGVAGFLAERLEAGQRKDTEVLADFLLEKL